MEELRKKIGSINQFQWLCFLPGVIFMVRGNNAIDAQHARNAALFRLACIIAGVILFVAFQIAKARYKQQLKALEQNETSNKERKL